jgi:DNA-binding transcriptional MerR regulator
VGESAPRLGEHARGAWGTRMNMLTEQQVLAACDISPTNLRHHASAGNIAHIRSENGSVLYRKADGTTVVALLAQQRARRSARYIAENPISNLNERNHHDHDRL